MSRRWTAKCWMGSSSGYVDLEVSAATINGAKEQLESIYGAQQIINLREVRSSSGGSSSGGDSGGILGLCAIGFALYVLLNYWTVIVGIGIAALVLWIICKIFSND